MTPRKGYYKDYTGRKFGLWTVLSFHERVNNTTMWLCRCDCGTVRSVSRKYLQEGISESCGCSYTRKGWIKGYLGFIPLTRGMVAIVSAHRVADLQRWNWHAVKKQAGWYACRPGIKGQDAEKHVYMARYILGMGPTDKRHADHKNRRTLDNRDRNLRPATHNQSQANKGVRRDSATGVKGVRRCKVNGEYVGGSQARIVHNKKEIYLGSYPTLDEARQVRNKAALKLHGEFAAID